MFILAPVAAVGLMGGFGQFAFGHKHTLPAFDVDPTSFVAHAPNALKISLGPERAGIVTESISRFGKTIALRPTGASQVKMDFETTSIGFSLRYVGGMKWSAEGEPPFVTWEEGTVGPGVPSAPANWALLTWRTERPPLLLVFSNPVGLTARRTEGGFTLETGRWTGTVAVRLPFGTKNFATSQAADFGGLLQQFRPLLPLVSAPAPRVLSSQVLSHAEGYELVVRFDSPGAAIPPAAVAAIEKGSARLLSPTVENGPEGMPICSTEELRIVLRAPGAFAPGTPVTYRGGLLPHKTTGAEDRLLAYITGNADAAGSRALSFVAPLQPMLTEPITGIGMPLASDGSGSYLAALRGAELVAQGKAAGFFDSIFAGVDWVTWQPPGGTPSERANAASVLSIAGPYCKSIDNRAIAAMANAGITEQTAWDAVRTGFYGASEKPAWFASIRSPLRIMTPGVVTADAPNGFKVSGSVETTESFDLEIRSDQLLETASHTNIARTMVVGIGDVTTVRIWPKTFGEWTLTFRRSAAGSPIPKAVPSPRYSAAPR